MVCKPCARPLGVNDHTPLTLAVVVPRTVEPSLMVTVALASAVPVSASLAVMFLPPLVSSASAIVTTGAPREVVGSQPSRFISARSFAVTGSTTPELENARNELLPTLAAQSPKSPLGLVLKLQRLVVPPSGEK